MLLAIDTATRVISIALHDGAHIVAESSWETANYHTVELAPAVEFMLRRAGIAPTDLLAVAVALGPGSFTGLRIGLGLAKGLAAARDIALVGIPTLHILAAAQPYADSALLAALQAGRGRIGVQPFAWADNGWTPQDEPTIVDWATALAAIEAPTVISGEVDDEGQTEVRKAAAAGKPVTLALPAERLRRAGYLADLARRRLAHNDADDPFTLVPIYLHQPGVPHP